MNIHPDKIDRSGLQPQVYRMQSGQPVYYFPDSNTELIRLDFTFPAGAAYQNKYLQSAAANSLFSEATLKHTAQEIAEFIDFRGIAFEKNIDTSTGSLTAYTLSRYLPELLPLLYEIFTQPLFNEHDFSVYMSKRRQQLQSSVQKTGYVARNLFYASIFGKEHPYGNYAEVKDCDLLTLHDVRSFYEKHYHLAQAEIMVSGCCNPEHLALIDETFGHEAYDPNNTGDTFTPSLYPMPNHEQFTEINATIPGAVQSTLRVGRLLPFEWHSPEYAQFSILNTVLGGYFGSRLMSNIREDKGYTYGIYSYCHMMRQSNLFFVSTDVGAQHAQSALEEIYYEMDRLCNEPIPEQELDIVRHYLIGDFLRSIDGIFERSERYRSMVTAQIDERFTDRYFYAIEHTTPQQLQEIARRIFVRDEVTQVTVGPEA